MRYKILIILATIFLVSCDVENKVSSFDIEEFIDKQQKTFMVFNDKEFSEIIKKYNAQDCRNSFKVYNNRKESVPGIMLEGGIVRKLASASGDTVFVSSGDFKKCGNKWEEILKNEKET